MSDVTSVFFSPPDDVRGCVSSLEQLLWLKFNVERDGDMTRYCAACLGLQLVLFGDHGFVNDAGIPFEDFTTVLDILVPRQEIDARVIDAYRLAVGRFVLSLITKKLGWKAILVDNLERLVEPL